MSFTEPAAFTIQGLILEPNLTDAISIRKIALATGTLLKSFPAPDLLLHYLEGRETDFVLIDFTNPTLECFDLVAHLRSVDNALPVLAILPENAGEEAKRKIILAGVHDFFVHPFGIDEFRMRIHRTQSLRGSRVPTIRDKVHHEDEIRNAIGEILMREYETLHVLGKAAEYKDQETGTHILRVANYARLIAEMIDESEVNQDIIYHSSALHDIGKIGIPDEILLKPARLTDNEYQVMQTHTTNGHGILERSESSYLLTGAMIALTHHERYDGTGYPMALSADEIPLYGRIVCVADVFDALTTKRPYKEPWTLESAFELLKKERGRQFDPELVDAFVSNAPRVLEIYFENRDPDEMRSV